jgi:hypothetical protein
MKIRTLSEAQAQRCWSRLIDFQLRGYTYLIKRRGKVVARLERARSTISGRAAPK